MAFAVLVSVVIFFFKIKSQKISYFVFLSYSSPPQLQLIPDLPPPYTDNFVSSLSVTNSPLTLLFMYCHMCGLSLELGDQPDSSLLEETESSLCRSYQWMLGCKQDFVCTSPSVLFFFCLIWAWDNLVHGAMNSYLQQFCCIQKTNCLYSYLPSLALAIFLPFFLKVAYTLGNGYKCTIQGQVLIHLFPLEVNPSK